MSVIHAQSIAGIKNDIQEKEGCEEPKIDIAQHGEPQDAVLSHFADLGPKIPGTVEAELLYRIGRGNAGDPRACEQAYSSQNDKENTRPGLTAVKPLGEQAARHSPQYSGEKRSQFKDAITPRQLFFRQQLRQESVLRGTEECRLRAQQEERNGGDR